MSGPTYADHAALLDQEEVWLNRAGETVCLEDMDVHYRANVIEFLRRRASRLWEAHWMGNSLMWVEDPSDGVFSAQMQAQAEYTRGTPLDWLERTPLMRRLREMDDRGPLGRKVTELSNAIYRITH